MSFDEYLLIKSRILIVRYPELNRKITLFQDEEKLAREKIKAQIAQDREDRAARFNATKQAELEAKAAQEKRLREEESDEAQRLAAEKWYV